MYCYWDEAIKGHVVGIIRLKTDMLRARDELRKASKRVYELEETLRQQGISPEQAQQEAAANPQLEVRQKDMIEKEELVKAADGPYLDEMKQWSSKIFLFACDVECYGLRCRSVEDAKAVKYLYNITKIPVKIFLVKSSPEASAIKNYAESQKMEVHEIERESAWTAAEFDIDNQSGAEMAAERDKQSRKKQKLDSHRASKNEVDEDDKKYPDVK